MSRTLETYLTFSYPMELVRDEDGGYFAQHPDLEGCAAQGETADEAVANLDAAREMWIRNRLADGLPVPEPSEEELSGRFLLRMPRWLHGNLARLARRENVSLNQLLNTVLASYAGRREASPTAEVTLGKLEEVFERCWARSTRLLVRGTRQLTIPESWTNTNLVLTGSFSRFSSKRRKTDEGILCSYFDYWKDPSDAPQGEESHPAQESPLVKA